MTKIKFWKWIQLVLSEGEIQCRVPLISATSDATSALSSQQVIKKPNYSVVTFPDIDNFCFDVIIIIKKSVNTCFDFHLFDTLIIIAKFWRIEFKSFGVLLSVGSVQKPNDSNITIRKCSDFWNGSDHSSSWILQKKPRVRQLLNRAKSIVDLIAKIWQRATSRSRRPTSVFSTSWYYELIQNLRNLQSTINI